MKDKDGIKREVIDFDSLPEELKFVEIDKETGEKQEFVHMGNLSSLALGAVRQLAEKVDSLEKSLANLQTRPQNR